MLLSCPAAECILKPNVTHRNPPPINPSALLAALHLLARLPAYPFTVISMSTPESTAIQLLNVRRDLSRELVAAVIERMLRGESSATEMSEFLVSLQRKGETVEELVGAASAMRRAMVRIDSDYPIVLDTCGTGGDGSQTFNISTAAAIVIAAAGVPVAKHGNRKVTSSTGSADVLAELGINLDASPAIVERCLNELKLCFCFAQRFHPAMKHVADVRRSIVGPTIFNRLGPLCNPASANRQILGVGTAELQHKLAAALAELGTDRSFIVRGQDGVDEVSLEAPTQVLEVRSSSALSHPALSQIETEPFTRSPSESITWSPSDFGLAHHARGELFADSPQSSAACIRIALNGQQSAYRDAVLINAAAGLFLAGAAPTLPECLAQAAIAIDTHRATDLITRLADLTHT